VATTRQLLKATGSSPTNLQFLEAMFWGAPDGTHTMVTAFSDDPDKGCWGDGLGGRGSRSASQASTSRTPT
jgi:hypothetical protein